MSDWPAQLARILERLMGVKLSGKGFKALCPTHDDHDPSLCISDGRDGKVLLHCEAGCKTEDVLKKLGLKWPDLFPPRANQTKGEDHRRIENLVAQYEYKTENGVVLAIKKRYELPDGRKNFRWQRPDGRLKLGKIRQYDLPLYRLPELLTSPIGEPVLFVEGEKACDIPRAHGLAAVSLPGGASQRNFGNALQPLQDRLVVLSPDNNASGRVLMQHVGQKLSEIGASEIRWLELPGLPEGGDVADYFSSGGTAENLGLLMASAPILDSRLLSIRYGNEGTQDSREDCTVETVQGLELPQPPRVDWGAVEPAVLAAIGNHELTEPEIRAAVRGNQRWTVLAIRRLLSRDLLTRSGSGRRGSPYLYAAASPSVRDFSIQDSRFIDSVNRETQHQEERRIENPTSVEVCVDGTPRRSEGAVPSTEAAPKPVIPERSGHEDWRTKIAGWSADERMLFEERAAIIEYDGGFPRIEAEYRAFAIASAMLAVCIANRRQEASL